MNCAQIYPCVENDDRWVVVALAWCTFVDVPLPGSALRIIAEPHCNAYLFSLN